MAKDDNSWLIWGAAGLAGLLVLGYAISTAKPTTCETCGKTEEEKANAKEPPCGCSSSK